MKRTLKTIPDTCRAINAVGSFCDCIAGADPVDAAASGFCRHAAAGSSAGATGEDLAELKKALQDLEEE